MIYAKRLIAFLTTMMLLLGGGTVGFAANDTVTISQEEYALLEKYKRLEEILEVIDSHYLWDYDVDKMLEGAAQGMLGALSDDYTYYYTPDKMDQENEAVTGEYGGLGIEVFANMKDQLITIRRVFHNSPAQHAGLRMNDKIIQVNGEDMTAFDINKAVSIMRGEVGGEVELTILRDTEAITVKCNRAIITTEILSYETLENNLGYIRIHYFEGKATEQFATVMEQFRQQGVKGLVLDLRDNPGGFVNLAVDIADMFVAEVPIMGTEDKYGRILTTYGKRGAFDIPVVVLINKYSASAAEILSAALSENGVAKLVGEKSFGKGIMQLVYPFNAGDGAGMQLTSDYWLTPKGNKIHEQGITPDVEVALPEDAMDDNFNVIPEKDTQLQAAVELLLKEEKQ